MNIALFSDCYSPIKNGVVTSLQTLRTGLEKRGHQVFLIVPRYPDTPNKTDPFCLHLPSWGAGMGSHQRLAFPASSRIKEFLHSHQPDIIHSHTEFTLGFLANSLSRHFQCPHLHTLHTLWEEYRHYLPAGQLLPPAWIRWALRLYFRGVTQGIAPSRKGIRYARESHIETPFIRIPNGVSPPSTVFSRDFSSHAARHLLFAGRLGKEKRVIHLLRACLPLLKSHPSVDLTFAGDGPEKKRLQQMVHHQGLENQVFFPGAIPFQELLFYYGKSHLFLTASLSEIHPLTIIEALQTGLPVLARRDEALEDLINPGDNGFLLESDQEFPPLIEKLLKNECSLQHMSARSLEKGKTFSQDSHTAAMEALYKKILTHQFR